ncbi:MAG: hypothetical protein AB1442_16295 [Nitrospirota bacterium]
MNQEFAAQLPHSPRSVAEGECGAEPPAKRVGFVPLVLPARSDGKGHTAQPRIPTARSAGGTSY